MKRREFISILGGVALGWPLATPHARSAKVPRIGYLGFGSASASAWANRLQALRAGLRDLGYIEGKNIVIEFRAAEGVEQLRELAAELVRMNVDVIVAQSSTEADHADPVGVGHVATLAQPGENITGLSALLTELVAKQLETLKEALPHSTRIGVLSNPTAPSTAPAVKAVEGAGKKLGIALHMEPARTVEDFERAFASMTRERVGGFLVVQSPLFYSQRASLANLALKHRLPGMFGIKDNVEAGGLMSYGADTNDLHRRAATYIDKILKGSKPSDLPVEQASKYELVINLKTAKALGITVPSSLLARADEVIE
jgi:ABC-type uncharacterized transport system substrate-binding protein